MAGLLTRCRFPPAASHAGCPGVQPAVRPGEQRPALHPPAGQGECTAGTDPPPGHLQGNISSPCACVTRPHGSLSPLFCGCQRGAHLPGCDGAGSRTGDVSWDLLAGGGDGHFGGPARSSLVLSRRMHTPCLLCDPSGLKTDGLERPGGSLREAAPPARSQQGGCPGGCIPIEAQANAIRSGKSLNFW